MMEFPQNSLRPLESWMKPRLRNPDQMTVRKKAAIYLYGKYRALQAKRHPLSYLFWECTLRCNLDCIHCGSDCLREAACPDMPIADFLAVLDALPPEVEHGKTILVLTGGEPLMRADLEEAGLEFQKRGFPWGFVTNGYAMTPQRFEKFVKAGLKAITVSLDGLESSHDQFRGRANSFQRAIQTISMAARTPELSFDVVTCVNQENFSELPRIRQMLIELGVKRWRIATVFPKGRAKEHPMLFLNDRQFSGVFEFLRETRSQGQIRASYGCEGYLGDWEGEVRDAPFFCRAGINIGSVLVDGSISACPSLRADYIQGNIYKNDFYEVWSSKFQIMRNRSWAKTGLCADCKDWNQCQGNGLHLRDEKTGELQFCHLERLRREYRHTLS